MSDTPTLPTTEAGVLALLQDRYDPREWAVMPGLRNGTGYSRGRTRTADVFAMNLWPSRGLALHGFEIKVSRADWRKELEDPGKADDMAKYADYWWLAVASDKIVQPGELPDGWGLLVAKSSRGSMKMCVEREATKREATPLDRVFIASIARNLTQNMVPRASIEEVVAAARKAGEENAAHANGHEERRLQSAVEALTNRIAEFERASGVKIDAWHAGHVGDHVRAVIELRKAGSVVDALRRERDRLRQTVAVLSGLIDSGGES